ncbi:MAG: IclR family transcriptional regulator domain-containing protein, partial [Sciscionella sp.]
AMGRVLLGGLDGASLHERLTRSTELGETYGVMCEPDRLTGLIRQAQVRGWAVVDQELEQGVRSVAVPLHDGNGAIVAALSVSTPASRVSVAALKAQFRQRLALVARQIEEYSNGAGG